MAGKIGPLLEQALRLLDDPGLGGVVATLSRLQTRYAVRADSVEHLPFTAQIADDGPGAGEEWEAFRERSEERLRRVADEMGVGNAQPLYLAHALSYDLPPRAILDLAGHPETVLVELDPVLYVEALNDVYVDLGGAAFQRDVGPFTGQGVTLAVLDSGIDPQHPFLTVADGVSVADEPVEIVGRHGTHCAGAVASTHDVYRGVAPQVRLLNVKVLKSSGVGTATSVVQGVQKALEMGADILSMSLGFNHLPTSSDGGHGWTCTADNKCIMCTAVDNAVALGRVVCVAAGNDHQRAEALRSEGKADSFDTELGCPGQAAGAITVGAVNKASFSPAYFSSCGPTSYGAVKPDLAADGVNVTSCVPVPRLPDGSPKASPSLSEIFAAASGTSIATPMVAAACALIIEERRQKQLPVTPDDIRKALLAQAVADLGDGGNVVGKGRLDLTAGGAAPPVG